MLGRSVGERILAGEDPFEGVADELQEADLVVGNLETTVGGAVGVPEDKVYTFRAPPESIDSLLSAGFDLVALANNHSYDYGADGLGQTIELLDRGGVEHVGAGDDAEAARAPVVLRQGGVETAFLAYVSVPDDWTGYRNRDWAATDTTPGVAWANADDIAADVAAVRPQVDHVMVLLHAGAEGSRQPNSVQRQAADAALDAGATAVIGAHPHVLQGFRHEDGRLTAWSLGNFVFDGFDDPDTTRSVILTVDLDQEGITDVAWTPVRVVDDFPLALDPGSADGRSVLRHLESLPSQR
jgi:poly-gamma-glutamate synthesis protein (capsule biosynthesis protein)